MVPKNHHYLLIVAFIFNIMAVLTSVVVVGLLVEGGKKTAQSPSFSAASTNSPKRRITEA
jgi:hypothetical protein